MSDQMESAFKQHMTGRDYGEEEAAEAKEHFSEGYAAGLYATEEKIQALEKALTGLQSYVLDHPPAVTHADACPAHEGKTCTCEGKEIQA